MKKKAMFLALSNIENGKNNIFNNLLRVIDNEEINVYVRCEVDSFIENEEGEI